MNAPKANKSQNPKKPRGLAAASQAKVSQRINRGGNDLAAFRTGPGKSRYAVEMESAAAKYFHNKRLNAGKPAKKR